MERPVSLHPDDVRDEKTKLIRSIKTLETSSVALGQYTAGQGEPGYTEDEDVPDDSETATYAVCRLEVDNERWEGVPMVMTAGKALDENVVEARLQLKSQPGFFGKEAAEMRNEVVVQVKPEGRIWMKMVVVRAGHPTSLALAAGSSRTRHPCAALNSTTTWLVARADIESFAYASGIFCCPRDVRCRLCRSGRAST